MDMTLFPAFEQGSAATDGDVRIVYVHGGSGQPLLLLHGHPQTSAIWHRVAPALARRFTLVAADLRGYGDSSKPPGAADHANYAKRTLARDMLVLMRALGFDRFDVLAHDRQASSRAAHAAERSKRPTAAPLTPLFRAPATGANSGPLTGHSAVMPSSGGAGVATGGRPAGRLHGLRL